MSNSVQVRISLKWSTLVVAAALLASCALPTTTSPTELTGLSSAELLEFQSHYMNSYNANTWTPVSTGRTTIAVGSNRPGGTWTGAPYPTGVAFATVSSAPSGTSLSDYPDKGMTTRFTVVAQSPRTDIYLVTATTNFPAGDARSKYIEAYYVQDVSLGDAPNADRLWAANPDRQWTSDDPVVAGGTWVQNQAARQTLNLVYSNGDSRQEFIYDASNEGGTRYALPAVDGSLQMKATSMPGTDSAATYSSVVGYITKPDSLTQSAYWSPSTTPPIVIGFRIYSEKAGVWSSVAFERIVVEDESISNLTTLAQIQDIVIYNGRAYGNRVFTPLGTSVLRENATTKTMQTNLFSNVKGLTYTLSLDGTGKIVLVSTSAGQLIGPY